MEDSKTPVLPEHLESQLKAIADGVNMVNEKLDTHIEENRREFQAIQKTIQKNFDDNRQDHQLMMQMIKELSEEQARLKRVK